MEEIRVRDRLKHMLEAIAAIAAYTEGVNRDDFIADRMRMDAVERNIERLSEASRHLPEGLKAGHPRIPWRQIADIGNALRHGYAAIEPGEIWATATDDLKPLKAAVEAMIREAREE